MESSTLLLQQLEDCLGIKIEILMLNIFLAIGSKAIKCIFCE
jgi:hypothetical protein